MSHNLTFLGKGGYEIPEGSARPPPPLVSDVGTKPLVSRRVKIDLDLAMLFNGYFLYQKS